MSVDPRAATGFGSRVEAYERGRPQYRQEAIDRLARDFGLTHTSTVLDLAAGTGKLTRQLVPLAGRVIAVEPSPAMLAELRNRVPQAQARAGTAEAIPLANASIDAVFVGQAFHWFRVEDALAEIARVLVPGGGLAVLWNRERWTGPWVERFKALVDPPRVAAGSFPGAGDWQAALERLEAFTGWQTAEYTHVHRAGIEEFVALVSSWSWIANLPDPQRAELLAEVRRELAGEPAVLDLPYATEVYYSRRT